MVVLSRWPNKEIKCFRNHSRGLKEECSRGNHVWLQVEPRSWREHRDCTGKECFAQIFKSAQYLKLPPNFNTITVLWSSGKTSEWISAVNLCAFCFVFIFICVCGGGEVRSCGVQERVLGLLQLEWQAVVDHLTWVLGTKLQPNLWGFEKDSAQ